MKNSTRKFRITALLLTAATIFGMLCGCSSKEAPASRTQNDQPSYAESDTTSQVPTTKADGSSEDYIVDPNMEPYLGTWVLAQENAEYTEMTITFNPDSTLEHNGATYTWTVEDNPDPLGTIRIKLVSVNDPDTAKLHKESDLLLTEQADDGTIYFWHNDGYYFHEDYLAQFDKVTLTSDNVCDYLQVHNYFNYGHDDFGHLNLYSHKYEVNFKDGMGLASWCVAEIEKEFTKYNATFYDQDGAEQLGDIIDSYQRTDLYKFFNFQRGNHCETGDWYMIALNDQGEFHRELTFVEVVGADEIIGVAYVPKNEKNA